MIISSDRGFTLVELAVALVIFSIGIVGVAAMQMESLKGNEYSTNFNFGVNLAKDLIETQQADTVSSNDFDTLPHVISPTGFVYAYRVTRTTQKVGVHDATRLTATVWWGRFLPRQSYSISTLIEPIRS